MQKASSLMEKPLNKFFFLFNTRRLFIFKCFEKLYKIIILRLAANPKLSFSLKPLSQLIFLLLPQGIWKSLFYSAKIKCFTILILEGIPRSFL